MSWFFANDSNNRQYLMSMGNAPVNGANGTILSVVYPTISASGIYRGELSNNSPVYGLLADSGKWYNENDFGAGGPTVDQNTWVVIGATKPAGSSTVRWHKATGLGGVVTWSHTNGDIVGDGSGPATQIRLFGVGTNNRMVGNIAAVAVYDSALTDLQVEALGTKSMANWLAGAPKAAYQFNVNPALTLIDLTGGGANQTNIPFTLPTLDTSNEPPGWAYYSRAQSSGFLGFVG
jgi:hypothetical protein